MENESMSLETIEEPSELLTERQTRRLYKRILMDCEGIKCLMATVRTNMTNLTKELSVTKKLLAAVRAETIEP